MNTETILLFAIGVFVLMTIGIILTMIEFNKLTEEPSQRKGAGADQDSHAARGRDGIRVVHSSRDKNAA